MKIGILTFFNGLNHGAFLQCYALQKTLESLGHDVHIINYEKKELTFNIIKVTLITYRLQKLKNNILKWINFNKELHHLNRTPRITTHQQLEKYHFDALVIGSDIVWHYNNKLFSFDSAYFGKHINASIKITYAASAGHLDYIKVPPTTEIIELMRSFSQVSVRDFHTRKFAEQVLQREIPIVPDPTLLLNEYDIVKPAAYKNYLLIYAYHKFSISEINYIKAYAKQHQLRIVNVGYTQNWCDVNLASIGPAKWLGLFRDATCIITGTFHGVLFSIVYNKQFVIIGNDNINPKLEYILQELNLFNRYIYQISDIDNKFKNTVDYIEVNCKLVGLRKIAIDYLNEALKHV